MSNEKELSAMMQLIEKLKTLSPAPGDTIASKAFHEGIRWSIHYATSLLPVEKQKIVDGWIEGNRRGWAQDTDWPEDAEHYYNSKFTKK